MSVKCLLLLPLICLVIHCDHVTAVEEPKKIVCNYRSWSAEEQEFNLETDMDASLCTHLIYEDCFVAENGKLHLNDHHLDKAGIGSYKKFNNLKQKNPSLKTLIWIKGYVEYFNFYVIAADLTKRATFLQSSIEFLQKYNFNGLVFDLLYPKNNDWESLAIWLKELRDGFKPHGFLLVITVMKPIDAYNIIKLEKQLDFLIILAAAKYKSSGGVAIPLPLYAGSADQDQRAKQRNFDAIAQFWIRQGIPRHKIVMGIPFYGHSFTLIDSQNHSVGAAHDTWGLQTDSINYNELCEMFKFNDSPWHLEWESKQMVPYAYRDNEWIGYENEKSVALKVDYVKEHNLGGIMIWSVEMDDFLGICDAKRYPLLRAINDGLCGVTIKSVNPFPAQNKNKPSETNLLDRERVKNKVQRTFRTYPAFAILILAILYQFLL